MNRLLGIDVGKARVGLALSDPLRLTAQPLEVIHRKKIDPIIRIIDVLQLHDISTIVVGLPLTLEGTSGLAVSYVERFCDRLETALVKVNSSTLNIVKWDERLSTKAAERELIAVGMRREKRKEVIDKVAATLILQTYLDAHSGTLDA